MPAVIVLLVTFGVALWVLRPMRVDRSASGSSGSGGSPSTGRPGGCGRSGECG